MFDTVIECVVKRRITPEAIAGRIGMMILDLFVAVLVILALLTESFLVAFAFVGLIGAVALTVMVFRKTKVEFEYNYFDDKLKVDKVMHYSSRRSLHTFDVNKMEVMAPEGSSHLGGGVNNHLKYDFSTHDDSMQAYILVTYDEDNDLCDLKFSPNDELINAIKKFHSRNVYDN